MQEKAQHIFSDHLLVRQNQMPVASPEQAPEWIPIYLIICLSLLVLIRSVAFQRAVRIVKNTFSTQVLQQLEREETNMFRPHSLALQVFFILNLSFLLYKLNEQKGWILSETKSLRQFSFFLLLVTALLILKLIANQVLAVSTGARKFLSEYTISSLLINQTSGLVLFPFLVIMQFTYLMPGLFLTLAGCAVGLALLLRWYRGLRMSLSERGVGFLQIFSYFCALEILPVLVLAKYVVETF